MCDGFEDDEIFGMATHYYDEEEIEVGKPINCQVVVNHTVELTEEEKEQARQIAEIGEDANWWDKLVYNVENLGETINNYRRDKSQRMDQRRDTFCRRADFSDVLLRHTCGAEDFHSHYGGILSYNVRNVAGAAMEHGMEPVDVKIPFAYPVGIRDLHVSVLYRLHSHV